MTARKPTLDERLPRYGVAVPRRTQAVMEGLRQSAMRFARDIDTVCIPGVHADEALMHVELAVAAANKALRIAGVRRSPTERTPE